MDPFGPSEAGQYTGIVVAKHCGVHGLARGGTGSALPSRFPAAVASGEVGIPFRSCRGYNPGSKRPQ
jgi:hypothetical protein